MATILDNAHFVKGIQLKHCPLLSTASNSAQLISMQQKGLYRFLTADSNGITTIPNDDDSSLKVRCLKGSLKRNSTTITDEPFLIRTKVLYSHYNTENNQAINGKITGHPDRRWSARILAHVYTGRYKNAFGDLSQYRALMNSLRGGERKTSFVPTITKAMFNERKNDNSMFYPEGFNDFLGLSKYMDVQLHAMPFRLGVQVVNQTDENSGDDNLGATSTESNVEFLNPEKTLIWQDLTFGIWKAVTGGLGSFQDIEEYLLLEFTYLPNSIERKYYAWVPVIEVPNAFTN